MIDKVRDGRHAPHSKDTDGAVWYRIDRVNQPLGSYFTNPGLHAPLASLYAQQVAVHSLVPAAHAIPLSTAGGPVIPSRKPMPPLSSATLLVRRSWDGSSSWPNAIGQGNA